jgi:predicted dehydrogenase
MPDPFRIAFVGIDHPHGAGWRESLAVLGDEVRLTAVVPAFGGAVTSLEERHADAPRFDTAKRLISAAADTFDGAVVCLPNAETPAVVAALAKAGKAVLCEKPLAASVEAAMPAADAVWEAGVAFQSGYLWRYDPMAERLRAMATDGRFGKLVSVEMLLATSGVARRGPRHYLFDADASGRGFFNWLGCHWLDLLPWLTGEAVTAVTARVGVFGPTPCAVEDGGTAILELSGGGLATLTGGYWLPRWLTEMRWTLRGGERWVEWEPTRPNTGGAVRVHGPQPQFHAMEEDFALPPDRTPGYGGARTPHLVRDWIAAARGGPDRCRNNLDSTLATLRLLDAVYQSSAEGRRVELGGERGASAP